MIPCGGDILRGGCGLNRPRFGSGRPSQSARAIVSLGLIKHSAKERLTVGKARRSVKRVTSESLRTCHWGRKPPYATIPCGQTAPNLSEHQSQRRSMGYDHAYRAENRQTRRQKRSKKCASDTGLASLEALEVGYLRRTANTGQSSRLLARCTVIGKKAAISCTKCAPNLWESSIG